MKGKKMKKKRNKKGRFSRKMGNLIFLTPPKEIKEKDFLLFLAGAASGFFGWSTTKQILSDFFNLKDKNKKELYLTGASLLAFVAGIYTKSNFLFAFAGGLAFGRMYERGQEDENEYMSPAENGNWLEENLNKKWYTSPSDEIYEFSPSNEWPEQEFANGDY